jgi:hypothetical protein
MVSDLTTRTSGLGTAGVTRDDFAAARAPPVGPGREVSSWDVALVVRVEDLVALAAGFALVLVFIAVVQIDRKPVLRFLLTRAYHVTVTRSRAARYTRDGKQSYATNTHNVSYSQPPQVHRSNSSSKQTKARS